MAGRRQSSGSAPPEDFGRFFLPGPVEVRPAILREMSRPMIAHRGEECRAVLAEVQPVLQALFGTDRPVLTMTSSGTGTMEAGLRALPPGRVLALANGAFSERFALIAARCGHEVERFDVRWGEVHDPAGVAALLRAGRHDAVTVTHSETSTGALQPLPELARAVASAGGPLLLVDAVSSLGALPLEFDASGFDYACAASQKALALPPGLAFAAASPRLLEAARAAPAPGLYFDLAAHVRRQPAFTPALPQLYALRAQAASIRDEEPAGRYARHAAMARQTWEWAERAGLEILAPAGHRSPSVTCLVLPDGLHGPDFVARVARRGYTVGHGYGPLEANTFRIGHMGDQTPETLAGLLRACGEALDEQDSRTRHGDEA